MLQIQNLFFSYGDMPYVLNNLNLELKDGKYISILGENGSGKSTLVKLILGILKPTKGTIKNTFSQIAYVSQRFESLNKQFPITVEEVLTCYQKTKQLSGNNLIKDSLDLVNMGKYADALIGNLSGGQFQKVFITRALMGNPDLLVLDEPSNGIDAKSQKEIYQLIRGLNQEKNITVICVEHNLKAAIGNSHLIYHIANGVGHMCNPQNYIKEYLKENTGVEKYVSI